MRALEFEDELGFQEEKEKEEEEEEESGRAGADGSGWQILMLLKVVGAVFVLLVMRDVRYLIDSVPAESNVIVTGFSPGATPDAAQSPSQPRPGMLSKTSESSSSAVPLTADAGHDATVRNTIRCPAERVPELSSRLDAARRDARFGAILTGIVSPFLLLYVGCIFNCGSCGSKQPGIGFVVSILSWASVLSHFVGCVLLFLKIARLSQAISQDGAVPSDSTTLGSAIPFLISVGGTLEVIGGVLCALGACCCIKLIELTSRPRLALPSSSCDCALVVTLVLSPVFLSPLYILVLQVLAMRTYQEVVAQCV